MTVFQFPLYSFLVYENAKAFRMPVLKAFCIALRRLWTTVAKLLHRLAATIAFT